MKIDEFPEDGIIYPNSSLSFVVCCDCGLRHAVYYEVIRGRKLKDDKIYTQLVRDDNGSEYTRKQKKYPFGKRRKR